MTRQKFIEKLSASCGLSEERATALASDYTDAELNFDGDEIFEYIFDNYNYVLNCELERYF